MFLSFSSWSFYPCLRVPYFVYLTAIVLCRLVSIGCTPMLVAFLSQILFVLLQLCPFCLFLLHTLKISFPQFVFCFSASLSLSMFRIQKSILVSIHCSAGIRLCTIRNFFLLIKSVVSAKEVLIALSILFLISMSYFPCPLLL